MDMGIEGSKNGLGEKIKMFAKIAAGGIALGAATPAETKDESLSNRLVRDTFSTLHGEDQPSVISDKFKKYPLSENIDDQRDAPQDLLVLLNKNHGDGLYKGTSKVVAPKEPVWDEKLKKEVWSEYDNDIETAALKIKEERALKESVGFKTMNEEDEAAFQAEMSKEKNRIAFDKKPLTEQQ